MATKKIKKLTTRIKELKTKPVPAVKATPKQQLVSIEEKIQPKRVKIKDLLDTHGFFIEVDKLVYEGGDAEKYNNWRIDFKKKVVFVIYVQDLYHSEDTYSMSWYYGGTYLQTAQVSKDIEVTIVSNTKETKALDRLLKMQIKKNPKLLSNLLGHKICKMGSDPEIFVEDEQGVVIPAFTFLSAKNDPNGTRTATDGRIDNKTEKSLYGDRPLYWDGFQAEFETAPTHCHGWHTDSVQLGLRGLYEAAIKHNPKAKLSSKTVMNITQDMLDAAAPEFVAFGCMPSKNAYGLHGLQSEGRDVLFRPAGGHIHFGIGRHPESTNIKIVKMLDAILGVACVSLFQSFDNPKRRELYGLAGEYRTPPHGLEYRTLSNAWLVHPFVMNLVFDIARKSMQLGMRNLHSVWNASEKEVIDCIMKSDVAKAQEILTRNKVFFLELLESIYGSYQTNYSEILFNIFINGLESAIKDPNDIVNNWMLDVNTMKWIQHSDAVGKSVSRARGILAGDKKEKIS